ncbi:AAA family ATPase [Flavobacterium phycosphaerae]|uniref:AAA family ATPase n=1 Tax=Flavobacterium phycosphaerae TaxID=2697515 RepID=UPI00138B19F1|nr:AAA family ATPase [Flavobacterium phycosphaerae]
MKNFRIFDDEIGFLEELSPINLLTGANNSGKSSLIKSLQMLKNSIKENQYPFDLDLNQQEHLLGDFENVLFNKESKDVEISLPFTFMGIKSLYISLSFTIPNSKSTYKAKLRGVKVIDQVDNVAIFSFLYRDATEGEKLTYNQEFNAELQEFNEKKKSNSEKQEDIFSHSAFWFPPFENPLTGYIEWSIKLDKLKIYLSDLLKFYKLYLENKSKWVALEKMDDRVKELFFIPSLLIKSFKNDIDIITWTDFVENKIGTENEITGKENVGERDFDAEDYFFPPYEIEDILYSRVLKILRNNLIWKNDEDDDTTYSVIENCFKNSWKGLIQRISTIEYISNIKEENSRIYNAAANTPFINLLKDYNSFGYIHSNFIDKYLKAFEIGKQIEVDYRPKYQLISVSITTLEGSKRELVDFGYGIKQLILILIQISVLSEKNKRTEHDHDEDGEFMRDYYLPSLLLVEEPETNLHPKWQSLLAEMFSEANKKFNIQFIIETHSEYLIRKFQTLVAQKAIDSKSIKIFYLRSLKKVTAEKKQIEGFYIQEDGSIDYNIFDDGFFDVNDKLELSLLNIQRDKFLNDFFTLKESKEEGEIKIVELQSKIDDYINKLDVSVYNQIITQRFDPLKITSISVEYLVSGQFLLHNIDNTGDFSPVILQYGRTIENEIKEIFHTISTAKKWMLGEMQGSLEKKILGTTTLPTCSNAQLTNLMVALTNTFSNPVNLRIDLLEYLRTERNSAGHSGLTKTKQEALDYIQKASEFLDRWIIEKTT